MKSPLAGKTVAILLADGFATEHVSCARSFLVAAGAEVRILSPVSGSVRGWDRHNWSAALPVDEPIETALARDYDMLVLPGGVLHVDALRHCEAAGAFVGAYVDSRKPIAAMGHGPQLLIDAGGVHHRRLTSVRSLRLDFIHAGAWWVNEPTVVDGQLLTARDCGNLLLFNVALIALLADAREEMPCAFVPATEMSLPAAEAFRN